jgi:hypothetical protein
MKSQKFKITMLDIDFNIMYTIVEEYEDIFEATIYAKYSLDMMYDCFYFKINEL